MKEYFLNIWGGAMPHLEKELGIKENYHYFETEKEREDFIKKIRRYSHRGLAMDKKEGIMTHKRTVADITLKYKDSIYKFEYDFGYDYPEDAALFQFEENNYSCDCNRSLFIQRYCDEDFEDMNCGEKIALKDIHIKYLD